MVLSYPVIEPLSLMQTNNNNKEVTMKSDYQRDEREERIIY